LPLALPLSKAAASIEKPSLLMCQVLSQLQLLLLLPLLPLLLLPYLLSRLCHCFRRHHFCTPSLHQREGDDVPDGRRVREQHHQAVDADAYAPCRRHAVLQGRHKVLIQRHLQSVQRSSSLNCRLLSDVLNSVTRHHPAQLHVERAAYTRKTTGMT
jgi:hypothetical protein